MGLWGMGLWVGLWVRRTVDGTVGNGTVGT